MPLPPMYFPVYPLHLRLLDLGLHANPLLQTPPTPHLEGLHPVLWVISDEGKLSSTVSGDYQRFALRNYDSGAWIPHLPVPVSAGPFLLDTWNDSKYVILFHQPNVQMDGSAVGVFCWGAAPPFYCFELKLPLPKFLAKRSVGGAARKAQRAAARALSAQERIGQLQDALRRDDIGPEEYHATEQKIAAEKKALPEHVAVVNEEADASPDARKFADDVDQKEFHRERTAAKEKLEEKHKADAKARSARAEADQHEASAAAIYRRQVGARGGADGTLDEAAAHEKSAAQRRIEAARYDEEGRKQGATAKAHQERAKDLRKKRSTRAQRQESGRKYQEKHGKDRNPYEDATGAGNMSFLMFSVLGHVPFSSTVQIYMSWMECLKNWVRAAIGVAFEVLKGSVGFIFDNLLPPGQGAVAAWVMDFCKGLATDTALGAVQKYVLEDQVSFSVSTKAGPVSVSAELEQDQKTGEWAWKVSGEPAEKTLSNLISPLGPVEYGSDGSGTSAKVFGHTYPVTPQVAPSASPQPSGAPPAPEPSYACTVDNPPVDYSSGPALSGAPAP